MKLLAAGALGSAAIMALSSGANGVAASAGSARSTPVTTTSVTPATASLTGDIVTVNPGNVAGGVTPGGTGTVSAQGCAILACFGHTTSQSTDGATSTENTGSIALGAGVSVQATPEPPPPPGIHAGVVGAVSGEVSTPIGTFGGSFETKVDVAPFFTGGITGSSISGSVTFPGIATIGQWLGNPNFAAANGVGVSLSRDAEGSLGVSIFPTLSGGEEASMRLGIFSGISTAGFPTSGSGTDTPGTGGPAASNTTPATDPAAQPFGNLTPDSPLTFAELTFMPPQSAGFPDPATATPTTSLPSAPSTGFPTLQQMMTMIPQGPANWPDVPSASTPAGPLDATAPSAAAPAPTAAEPQSGAPAATTPAAPATTPAAPATTAAAPATTAPADGATANTSSASPDPATVPGAGVNLGSGTSIQIPAADIQNANQATFGPSGQPAQPAQPDGVPPLTDQPAPPVTTVNNDTSGQQQQMVAATDGSGQDPASALPASGSFQLAGSFGGSSVG